MYYLDTNICIYFINGKYQSLKNKILSIPPSKIRLPSIVKAELLLGAYKSPFRIKRHTPMQISVQSWKKAELLSGLMTYL